MWGVLVLFYFIAAVAEHAILCRLVRPINVVVGFLLSGVLMGMILISHEVVLYGLAIETWTAVFIYAFMCELYIFMITFIRSSVSVSVLLLLRKKTANMAELDRDCNSSSMVNTRLEKLCQIGLLDRSTPGYILTKKGNGIVAVLKVVRRFFSHKSDL